MDQDELLRWSLERSDRLRATVASSAGLMLAASVLTSSGLSFVTQAVWQEMKGLRPHVPWTFVVQMVLLSVSWVVLIASIARALEAVAAANGLDFWEWPSRFRGPPLLAIKDEASVATGSMNDLLKKDLAAAAQYFHDSQRSLHKAEFNLALVVLLVVVSYMARGVVQR